MISENDVRKRISALLEQNKLTENKLAGGDSSTQKRLNRQLSHDAAITLDTLLRIVDAVPDVSLDWLIKGEKPSSNLDADKLNATVDVLLAKNRELQNKIDRLESEQSKQKKYVG